MGNISVDYDVLNQKGSPAWYSDLFANIPTPGYKGRMFISTDTFAFYRDNGTGWDLVGGPGTGTITGAGVSGQLTYFIGTDTIGGNNNLFYDITNSRLGIGTATPGAPLDIHSTGTAAQFNGTGVNNSFVLFQNAGSSKWRIGNLYNSGANDYQIFDVTNSTARLTIKNTGASTLIGTFTATSLIKSGGTNLQILLADGSTTPTSTFGSGSVTNVSALTLGTTGTDLTSSVVNSTTTPVITLNVPTASATNRGALSSADWTTFNNKQATLSLTTTGTSGAATLVGATLNIPNYTNVGTVTSVAALTLGTSGTDLSSSVANSTSTPVITLNVPTASATNRGALSTTDWTTFNNKQATISVTAPVVLTGATISMPAATTSVSGYLTSTDWNTFNNKTSNLGTVTDVVALTIGTSGIDITSTAVTTTTTPVITLNIPTASASNRGALSSTDWTTFNNKQATLSLTTTGTSGAATLVANTLNVPNYGSALSGYLPLTGGTLTGALNGTAATFTGILSSSGGDIRSAGTAADSVTAGPFISIRNTSNAYQYLLQLNATYGLDFWNFGGTWNKRMTLDASGNLGIGNGIPSQLLHLETTLGASTGVGTAIQITSGGAGGDQAWVGVNKGTGNGLEFSVENRDIIFNTLATTPFGGTERLRIASTGTATFTNSVTAVGLYSSTTAAGNLAASVINNVTSASGSTGYGLAIESEASAATSYALTVRNLASTNTYFHISTETGRVGYIGMGTTTPDASEWNASARLLHIYQNTTNGSVIKLESSNAKGIIGAGNDLMQLGTTTNDPLAFYTNLTEKMRIASNGNVGIATTMPTGYGTTLQVSATNSSDDSSFVLGSGLGTSTNRYLAAKPGSSGNFYLGTDNGDIYFATSLNPGTSIGTTRLTISSTGAATFSSTLGINGTSDNIKASTYQPTLTAVLNYASGSGNICTFSRIANIVTVFFDINVNATAVLSKTECYISLPIASSFTTFVGVGSGVGDISSNYIPVLAAYGGGTNIVISFYSPATSGTYVYRGSFSYEVT